MFSFWQIIWAMPEEKKKIREVFPNKGKKVTKADEDTKLVLPTQD